MRLPEFLTELSPVRETLAALEQGENAMAEAVAEKNGQVCVETATGGLTLWERDYGLPVREGAAMEDRRAAVRAAMAGGRTLTPAFLKELCVTLGGGDRGEVEEDFAHWSVTALAVGAGRVPADIPALKRAVERLKPAHLSVTVLPTAAATDLTEPSTGAETSISIFMASSTTSTSPAWTESPTLHSTLNTLPGMGLFTAVSPAATAAGAAAGAGAA